jgi:D-2-hydroxyglutarate dehydrogenase
VFVRARQKLGEILSAFEFLDQASVALAMEHLEGVRNPLPDTQTPFYLVVETHGSNEGHDYEKLQVSVCMGRNSVEVCAVCIF